LQTRIKPSTPKDKLSLELATPPPRKKFRTTFGSLVNHLEENGERTCSNEIGGREEKSLMQHPRKATLRKNLNPTWIK
jgi:hypothetical protein